MNARARTGELHFGGDFDDAREQSGIHYSLRQRLERRSTTGTRACLRVTDGDWGGARQEDVETVARSVVEALTSGVGGEFDIRIDATSGSPMALSRLGPRGEFVVRLCVRGDQWAQLSYQFAHELCHVLADVTTWRRDRFAWLEDALCEAASLYALRSMALSWEICPPRPEWQQRAAKFSAYAVWRMQHPVRMLASGIDFHEWLAAHLPALHADAERRDDNTIIAKELLPIFEADPAAWRAVRYLHTWQRDDSASLAEFLESWSLACPEEVRGVVERIAGVFGVASEMSGKWPPGSPG
jgi:hypothetical protein